MHIDVIVEIFCPDFTSYLFISWSFKFLQGYTSILINGLEKKNLKETVMVKKLKGKMEEI